MTLFTKSVVCRYPQQRGGLTPKLASYVDDISGAFAHMKSFGRALDLHRYMCETGASLTLVFNPQPKKTPLLARKQVILGRLYDSISRRVRTTSTYEETAEILRES